MNKNNENYKDNGDDWFDCGFKNLAVDVLARDFADNNIIRKIRDISKNMVRGFYSSGIFVDDLLNLCRRPNTDHEEISKLSFSKAKDNRKSSSNL
ncbi:hypothetical protein YC2023_046212 [Brassica napus]